MMNELSSKRREWVKNAAIIFLSVMLVLTFFSNTIMNYSLPEVATAYVQPGTITEKVRGTGNVEATDPYNVMTTESRVIASVAVTQGDFVEKDQVIYYLEEQESEELENAKEELEELELAYMKGLFGGEVSADVINKVASGNVSSFATLQANVTDMQTRLQAAEDRVKECQDALNALNLQSSISTNDASVSTIPNELEAADATTDLASAKESFENRKAERIAELNAEITEIKKQIADLEVLIANGEGTIGDSTASDTTDSLQNAIDNTDLTTKLNTLNTSVSATFTSPEAAYEWSKNVDWSSLSDDGQLALQNFLAAYADYQSNKEALSQVTGIVSNQESLNNKKAQLEKFESKLAEVSAITVSSSDSVQDAQERLDTANQNIKEITSANKQSSVAYQNKILNAEAALKNAQAVYDLLKEEQATMAADINAELDLSKTNKDIAEKKEEIAKLEEKAMGASIKAPVSGTVTSLAYVAGETTKPEQAAAVIQIEGKGFTVSFAVTNEQAKKVKVGDMAELQNAWYYDDVQAILSAVKPDPESAGQKKLLVFDVTGSSITAGQTLNLSVGQRSAEYELVVPNSAIREDSNGKFILIVESKSSPLGNRYMATRVDVEVQASDDNNTAISAGLYGYEYVITTSTKPIEAGMQVRLNET
ncbi:MAG: HlyD family efflux transporter periplasmic adaptor subunit [Lachnospiraceae bacterium]|nr:HlyD family efflux transporter periplasmic adaptor subunit [Lachnospiraceae bacterium]